MPSFDLRQSANKVYYIHWTDGRRSKRVSTREKGLAGAKAFLASWLTCESSGADALTCEEVWTLYWEQYFLKTKSAESIKSAASAWAVARKHFGPVLASDLGETFVADYVSKRATGRLSARSVKAGTIRHELTLLRASLSWAKNRGHIQAVPFFTMPEPSPRRERWLEPDDVTALLRVAKEQRRDDRLSRVEIFLWLAIETLKRKTAICELEWSRVDFATGIIDFDIPGRARTKKRRGIAPISDRLRPVLERAYRERTNGWVLGSRSDIYESVVRVGQLAGIERVHPHLFRHTGATLMLRNGADIWPVAGLLAATVRTTTQTYAKHVPEQLREVVNGDWR